MTQRFDYAAYQAQLWTRFPYERVETTGARALAEWTRLRTAGRGWPVVVGSDEDFLRIAEAVVGFPGDPSPSRTPQEILVAASMLQHPEALRSLREAEHAQSQAYIQEMLRNPEARFPTVIQGGVQQSDEEARAEYQRYAEEGYQGAEVGEWPSVPPQSAGLSIASDILTGKPYERVHIVLAPTPNSYEAPAYLKWGGWNACPFPEHHVAAMRSWHARYGAELVGMSGDVVNLRLSQRPRTREEAISLAREQYEYCNDLIDQGVGTLSNLAAGLMADDWWYFWWD